MPEYLDFFSIYVMGSVEMLFQFYFYARILKRKVKLPFYLLYAVCASFVVHLVPPGTVFGFVALVLMLTAGGMLLGRADWKTSLLYAALVAEIMLLSYGIVKSLSGILNPLISAALHMGDMAGIVLMLAADAASLGLTGICYSLLCRYFSGDALYSGDAFYSGDVRYSGHVRYSGDAPHSKDVVYSGDAPHSRDAVYSGDAPHSGDAVYSRDALYSGDVPHSRDARHPGAARCREDARNSGDTCYPAPPPLPFDAAAQTQYMYLVFIPVLMIFIMGEYVNTLEYDVAIMEDGESFRYLFSHGQLLVMHLLGLASLFCILFTYKKLLQSFQLGTKLSLLEQEEHSLNQYVEEAKAHYERTKSFRHDIRNHIAVIKRLLQSGKLEQAVSYVEDMDDMAEKMSFPCSTNNPVADILVGSKLGLAKSMGIRVSCSLWLPYPCGLRDMDICIVLSNALDNAIHACRGMDAGDEKHIHVSGRIQGDFLMVEVENSFCGKAVLKPGTGLSNVKAVAEKYGGAMSVETRGNVFALQVLLIVPQRPEEDIALNRKNGSEFRG